MEKNRSKKSELKTLEQFKDEQYGKRGTFVREKLETGYEKFKAQALAPKHAHKGK